MLKKLLKSHQQNYRNISTIVTLNKMFIRNIIIELTVDTSLIIVSVCVHHVGTQ